jgi:hypothetical protein
MRLEFSRFYCSVYTKKAQTLGLGFSRFLVPAIGFELMTYRLQGGCSTN